MQLYCDDGQAPHDAHIGKRQNCSTERRNTEREKREVAIMAVLAEGVYRVDTIPWQDTGPRQPSIASGPKPISINSFR
jgi:hypothetical protein